MLICRKENCIFSSANNVALMSVCADAQADLELFTMSAYGVCIMSPVNAKGIIDFFSPAVSVLHPSTV